MIGMLQNIRPRQFRICKYSGNSIKYSLLLLNLEPIFTKKICCYHSTSSNYIGSRTGGEIALTITNRHMWIAK